MAALPKATVKGEGDGQGGAAKSLNILQRLISLSFATT